MSPSPPWRIVPAIVPSPGGPWVVVPEVVAYHGDRVHSPLELATTPTPPISPPSNRKFRTDLALGNRADRYISPMRIQNFRARWGFLYIPPTHRSLHFQAAKKEQRTAADSGGGAREKTRGLRCFLIRLLGF